MRLEEQSAAVRDAVPVEYADLVVSVTELGGTTLLMLLLAVLFWCVDRRRSALVISYAIAGLALLLSLKALFALPRPPEDAMLIALEREREGYGFPSGHAFAAAVVYGGLVSAFDRARDPRALLAAGVMVALVSLSRVVLGVHYLGDVIVGAALGVGFVVAMDRLTRGDPTIGFAVALALSVPAIALAGGRGDALLGLGGSIGGLLSSLRLSALPALRSRLEGVALVVLGGSFVGVVQTVESAVASIEPLVAALYAILVAGIFFVPAAVGRLEIGVLESRRT
ncbi:phosphatase PAP2 family protein [Natrinema versiforme]|uniref:Phosphoesterase PA-phosphatase-like protein n=1 Tax=Natrinema versiforme JCM 10478 TaxID=1227496 RepID=L9Y2B5_9EURY|nr:phosphatase PAP2 family protein [Natrinema versiforme]ELY67831.1 phosphoesterase PA-phosphatase-like protein [Natrinema versiforme JCM 10478]